MSDKLVSVDEFIASQKGAVKDGEIVLKAFKAPSSWSSEKRTARFTISAQTEDRDRDVIWQDGLDTTHFEQAPVALMFHNGRSWPIGRWSDIAKNLTGRPKRTEATLNLLPKGKEPDADRAAVHIENGTLTSCSIGFIPKEVRKREMPEDKKDTCYWPGYEIMSAELVEVSVVPVPSLREAQVKGVGCDVFAMPRDIIEEILDNWAKSPAGLLVPRAEFDAAYKDATGNRTVVVVMGEGPAPNAEMIKDAVTKALNNETPADEDPSTGDDHQKTADQAGAKDDAGAAKTVVLDGNQAVTDTVTGKTTTEPPSEPPEDWYGTLSGLPAEKKGSFLQWLMKLFGSNAESHLEQELRAKSAADEAEEQARKDALEARRKELQTRFQSISTRVEEKGLV
jgi:HK97 family phage prohead protease